MRTKIMFVINSLAGGGAERIMAILLTSSVAQAEQYDIVLVLLDRDEEAYTLPEWLRVIRLDCGHSFTRSLREAWRVIRAESPDLTLSFLTRANVVTAAVMAILRKPFILSERVNTLAHLGDGGSAALSKWMLRKTYPRATRICAVSEGVAATLVSHFGVARERIAVVANPVDIERIIMLAAQAPAPPLSTPYVAAMGRLVPNKNFTMAIEAFARSGLQGNLVIMGQGPQEAELRQLASRLGIGERVILMGFVVNPYAVIARADIMLLTSNAEGFPNALVEAMAAGAPVVATDCASGPAEVLDAHLGGRRAPAEGRGGLLVPVNDVESAATALRQMSDPAIRARFIESGQNRVKEFSVSRAVGRYWALIEEALGART
ncbi:putative glycosyltransferase [Sphingomonas paucimobilis]|nr:putative glycosyltransferase [Sphingomonas paucimobilis]